MIKIERTETSGWEVAIRGMRNPMNSWDKSDSRWCRETEACADCLDDDNGFCVNGFVVGEKDLALMRRLAAAGTDHGKFLRMILVTADLTAPLYWWKEYDTYKVGTVANSCSTMHKIHARPFVMDDFSHEHLNVVSMEVLENVIAALNLNRFQYQESGDKDFWWQMIQLLPSTYNQKRTVLLNYAVLKNIYHSRKDHKLDEWREFCRWIESLPYSELITE